MNRSIFPIAHPDPTAQRTVWLVAGALASAVLFVLGYWFLPAFFDVPVRAATTTAHFDADIRASTTNELVIGEAAAEWISVNQNLFFSSSSNVGIATSSFTPNSRVHVVGGNVYFDTLGYGIIMKDSTGSCWRTFMVSSDGASLITQSVTCP